MDGQHLGGMKLWKCKNGHVLGVIKRVKVEGEVGDYHVSRLLLFRQAEPFDQLISTDNVMAALEGTAHDIKCSMCGATRTWWLGGDALERLLNAEGRMRSKIQP